MDITKLSLEEFIELGRKELQFLVHEYGFQEISASKEPGRAINPYKLIFARDDLRIELEGLNYGLRSTLSITDDHDRVIHAISLFPSDLTLPNTEKLPKSYADSQTQDIMLQSSVLREFGKELLSGDDSEFEEIILQNEAKWNEYEERRSFGIAIQDAVAAYQEEQWQHVVVLLEPYEAELSKKMIKRLNFAREQL